MEKKTRVCHDVKTERPDVGRPLPGVLRVVPAALYVCTIGFIAGVAWLTMQMHDARDARARWKKKEAEQKTIQTEITKKMDNINNLQKRAEEAQKWVAGSEMIHDLVVTICNTAKEDTHVGELSIVREKDNPRQLKMTMRLSTGTSGAVGGVGASDQVDKIKGAIQNELDYRTIFETSKVGKNGQIDWVTTLQRPDNWRPNRMAPATLPQ
jgi:hypothetical protein